jgi:methionyl-tRNA synthetase
MTDMENPTPVDTSTTDPAAAPRTTTFPEIAALPVDSSNALTTGPDPTKPAPEPSATTSPAPVEAAQITIDDFAKIELRVAQILVAERIPKADKLLRLEVDLGPDFPRRQILSGIAEWYAPEDLVGRRIVVITNLAPRKMRGLESHGMLLAASHGENGKPVLATFGEDIALGSRLK